MFFFCFVFLFFSMLVEDAACWWGKEEINENIRMLRGNNHKVS